MQTTEALCHLSVTDIKKTFCNIWFFCKNEACANCTDWKATTVIWLLLEGMGAEGDPPIFLKFRRTCNLQGAATRFTNCHRMIGQIFVCLQSMYLFVSISLIFFLGIMTKLWKKIELNKTVNWTKEPLSYRLPIGWRNMSTLKVRSLKVVVHKSWMRHFSSFMFFDTYRISANSFHPWVVSSLE